MVSLVHLALSDVRLIKVILKSLMFITLREEESGSVGVVLPGKGILGVLTGCASSWGDDWVRQSGLGESIWLP